MPSFKCGCCTNRVWVESVGTMPGMKPSIATKRGGGGEIHVQLTDNEAEAFMHELAKAHGIMIHTTVVPDHYSPEAVATRRMQAGNDKKKLLKGEDPSNSYLIPARPDAQMSVVAPSDEKWTLQELQDLVGATTIEVIRLHDSLHRILIVDEDGKMKGLARNARASSIAGINIVGTAVETTLTMLE